MQQGLVVSCWALGVQATAVVVWPDADARHSLPLDAGILQDYC
jgi:hypothetical protein